MDNVRFKGARHAARIDQHVGDRIRCRRTLLGFTQEQLADALDISYQQIQKYETGANRVSAGRLYQISQRLEVPITFFFEGLGMDFDDPAAGWANRTTIEAVRALNQIGDSQVRNAVTQLLKSLATINGEHQGHQADRFGDDHHGHNGNGNGNGNGKGHGNHNGAGSRSEGDSDA